MVAIYSYELSICSLLCSVKRVRGETELYSVCIQQAHGACNAIKEPHTEILGSQEVVSLDVW